MENRPRPGSPGLPGEHWAGPGRRELVLGRWQIAEHHVMRLGMALSAALLVAALIAFTLPTVRLGHWAGTHLALAGAALVAIGTLMPHFGVTLAGARPEPPALRLTAVLALAVGAILVVGGVLTKGTALIVGGAVALLQVAIGIALPVLFFVGWEPALVGWNSIRPPLAAVGLVLAAPLLATVGAVSTAIGAAGQLVYAWTVWRRRAAWTTDPSWHRLTNGHLTAGMGWFLFACVLAAVDVIDGGLPPDWTLGALAMPLLGGWVIQILVGAWSYLLPVALTGIALFTIAALASAGLLFAALLAVRGADGAAA